MFEQEASFLANLLRPLEGQGVLDVARRSLPTP